jgi:transketolase
MTMDAYEQLTTDGIRARVVGRPSMELFDKQPQSYREEVLPTAVMARVAVEKGSPFGWDRWVGTTRAPQRPAVDGRRIRPPRRRHAI